MKAIVYARVSTEEQATSGYSLPEQVDNGKQKAVDLGVHPDDILVFEDKGISGEIINRPALMDAIASISDDVKFFICKDPDRLSRDAYFMLHATKEIESTGAQLIYTHFDRQNTPDGNLLYTLRGAIAEFEKEMIKRRTYGGKLKKAKKHLLTHWPGIYGYNYDKTTQLVSVNDEQAEILRLMFEWGKTNGVYSIVRRLNDMGIMSPRGSKWGHSTVRRILKNETYKTGIMYIRKYSTEGTHLNKYKDENKKIKRKIRPEEEWIDIRIPPIIDESAFDAVQRRIEVANRQSRNNVAYKYLLSGLIRCAICGYTWHGQRTHSGDPTKKRKYYVCSCRAPGVVGRPRCVSPYVPGEVLENGVWNIVKSWILDPNKFEEYMKAAGSFIESKSKNEIALLKKQIDLCIQEREEYLDLIKQRAVRSADVADRLKEITNQLEFMEKQLEELTAGQEETAVDRQPLYDMTTKYKDKIETVTFEQKYEILHEVVKQIIVDAPNKNTIIQVTTKKAI